MLKRCCRNRVAETSRALCRSGEWTKAAAPRSPGAFIDQATSWYASSRWAGAQNGPIQHDHDKQVTRFMIVAVAPRVATPSERSRPVTTLRLSTAPRTLVTLVGAVRGHRDHRESSSSRRVHRNYIVTTEAAIASRRDAAGIQGSEVYNSGPGASRREERTQPIRRWRHGAFAKLREANASGSTAAASGTSSRPYANRWPTGVHKVLERGGESRPFGGETIQVSTGSRDPREPT